MDISNMLLVGSTGRNTGKTTFCVSFIDKWNGSFEITGLKVTTIHGEKGVCHHGDKGCGVCTSIVDNFEVLEETDRSGSKDTCKLLAAGAKRVYWVRAMADHIAEAVNTVLAQIPKNNIIVCESNSLVDIVTPGVTVLMHKSGVKSIKPSAASMIKKADFIADITDPEALEPVIDKISVTSEAVGTFVSHNGVYKDFALIVLAGGRSSRMGRDKANLMYNGWSFLENLVNKGRIAGFSEIIISGSEQKILGASNVMDELSRRGPLGGIHACLKAAKASFCFVVTVDVPKLDFDMLASLAEFHLKNDRRATLLVVKGKLEPLIGVYNSDLYNDIYEIIKDKPQRIIELFDTVPCWLFDFRGDIGALDNINTPDDYKSLLPGRM